MTKRTTSLRAYLRVIAPGNTVPFKEVLHLWGAVGNTVSGSTGSILNLRLSGATRGWAKVASAPWLENLTQNISV